MRKIMLGTRSEQGERAVERLLTIVRTCQLQQLNALVYLTATIAAHRCRQPAASLLRRPQPPELLQRVRGPDCYDYRHQRFSAAS
jgi:hypothetical protein